jgi:molybdenum cofactor synthesis domain-containing protein
MDAAVLTISTRVAGGEADDVSGPALVAALGAAGLDVVAIDVVGDDADAIEERLRFHVAADRRFVVTTGGTGLTVDDVTPEATRRVIERDAPGIAEALRREAERHTPLGILTRGLTGVARRTLIVNLPGNPKAIDQLVPVLVPLLEHAAGQLER